MLLSIGFQIDKKDPSFKALCSHFNMAPKEISLVVLNRRLTHEVLFFKHHRPLYASKYLKFKNSDPLNFVNEKLDDVHCSILAPIIRRHIADQNSILNLDDLDITRFPDKLWDIPDIADYLNNKMTLLSCNKNFLYTLPRRLKECKKLEEIRCNHNAIVYLPEDIIETGLSTLYASDNRLVSVPSYFGLKIPGLDLHCRYNYIKGLDDQWDAEEWRNIEFYLPYAAEPRYKADAPIEKHYAITPAFERWFQRAYDTPEEKRRLGRLVGGSFTVSKEEKDRFLAYRKK